MEDEKIEVFAELASKGLKKERFWGRRLINGILSFALTVLCSLALFILIKSDLIRKTVLPEKENQTCIDVNNPVETDKAKAEIVREWYVKKFNGDDPPLTPFMGTPRPLNIPITSLEVERAAKALKNGKSNGPDDTPNELIKYAGMSFYNIYANIINQCFMRR